MMPWLRPPTTMSDMIMCRHDCLCELRGQWSVECKQTEESSHPLMTDMMWWWCKQFWYLRFLFTVKTRGRWRGYCTCTMTLPGSFTKRNDDRRFVSTSSWLPIWHLLPPQRTYSSTGGVQTYNSYDKRNISHLPWPSRPLEHERHQQGTHVTIGIVAYRENDVSWHSILCLQPGI